MTKHVMGHLVEISLGFIVSKNKKLVTVLG